MQCIITQWSPMCRHPYQFSRNLTRMVFTPLTNSSENQLALSTDVLSKICHISTVTCQRSSPLIRTLTTLIFTLKMQLSSRSGEGIRKPRMDLLDRSLFWNVGVRPNQLTLLL